MKAVFHRQWRAFSHSVSFYVFLTLLAVGLGGLVAMFHGSYQYANFEYVLWYFSVFFAFVLPILTVRTFAEERKKGMNGFLKALPLSAKDLVLGKLLASGALLLALSVILLVIPILLGVWGSVYYPSAYIAVFAFLLFGFALLSVNVFIALMLRNVWVAMGVSYAVAALMLGLYYFSLVLPAPLSSIAEFLSILGSYSSFVFGILDLGAIVLYLSVGALFTCLTLLYSDRVWKE